MSFWKPNARRLTSSKRLMLVVLIVVLGAFGVWVYLGTNSTLFLGDSILYGLNSAARFRFATSGAMIGALSTDLVELYHDAYATQRFNRYVIMIGTNDLLNNVEDSVIRANVTTLVKELKAKGGEIVLCSLLPLSDKWGERAGSRVKGVNDWLRTYAGRNGLRYLDFYSAFVGADGLPRAGLLADGLHPSEQGYAVITDMLTHVFSTM